MQIDSNTNHVNAVPRSQMDYLLKLSMILLRFCDGNISARDYRNANIFIFHYENNQSDASIFELLKPLIFPHTITRLFIETFSIGKFVLRPKLIILEVEINHSICVEHYVINLDDIHDPWAVVSQNV